MCACVCLCVTPTHGAGLDERRKMESVSITTQERQLKCTFRYAGICKADNSVKYETIMCVCFKVKDLKISNLISDEKL